jgi:small-conductance mechanosensitive channel
MELVIESLRADWEAFLRFAPRLFYGLVLLVIFLTAAKFAGQFAAKVLHRSARFRSNERFLQHAVRWSISSLGVLLALGLMGFQGIAASLLATGGVVAIVLGFAFREIGENFLAGFFLTFSRPFELGDLIKTGDLTGNVRSIELRSVDGLRRPSFTVGVAYHDEPEQVIALLETAARGVPDVIAEPQSFVTIKEFGAQFVEYEVFFWLDVNKSERGYVATRNDVKVHCWRALRDAGMTFSTDVSTGLDLKSAPDLIVDFVNRK